MNIPDEFKRWRLETLPVGFTVKFQLSTPQGQLQDPAVGLWPEA